MSAILFPKLTCLFLFQEHKRRLGSALSAGKWWHNSPETKRFDDFDIQGDGDAFETVDKRRIGAALNRLSYQYPPYEEAYKRRIGAAKNVRYGSWNYKTDSKRRIGAALNQGYKDYTRYYAYDKRGIGPALNAVRQDLWYDHDNGKRLDSALNAVLHQDTPDWVSPVNSLEKRRLGSALNTRYKSWMYKSGRQKREADDTKHADTMAAGQSLLDTDKRRIGSALNVKYAMAKKTAGQNGAQEKQPENEAIESETPVARSELHPGPMISDVNDNSLDMDKVKGGADTEDIGHFDTDKRRLGSALNSMSNAIKLKGTEAVNRDGSIIAEDDMHKRRLGAALNMGNANSVDNTFKGNNDKRRLGSALNAKHKTWNRDQYPSKKGFSGSDGFNKRRIGAALNVGNSPNRYPLYVQRGTSGTTDKKDVTDLDTKDMAKRRLGSALNTKYQSGYARDNYEKRRLGNALNALSSQYVGQVGLSSVSDKRRIGSALNAKYLGRQPNSQPYSADKRGIGAALNLGLHSGSRRHQGSALKLQWLSNRPIYDKRRIGSALNTKYQGWQYRDDHQSQIAEEKRGMGRALNAGFGDVNGRSKRFTDLSEDTYNFVMKNRVKRSLGPLLGKRLKRSADGDNTENVEHIDSEKGDSPAEKRRIGAARNVWRPKYDSSVLQNKEPGNSQAPGPSDLVKADNQLASKLSLSQNTVDKRHLGSLIRVGSPFPMTKFSPSRYLRKIDPHEDMAKYYERQMGQEVSSNDMSKAQMYKFYG